MSRLNNKIALVAGASSGIGRACALNLAAEGAFVIVAARRKDLLAEVVGEIQEVGGNASAIAVDLTLEKDVCGLFEKIQTLHGRLDILVNSIGSFGSAPIDQMSVEMWERVVDSNLKAPFLCIREAMKIMKSQGRGRIINIGSTSAKRVRPNSAAYSSAKHGLWGLTQVAALEGCEYGVSCCCVHPGRVEVERSPTNPSSVGEPLMQVEIIANTVCYISGLPDGVNMLETIVLPTQQPFVGRG